MSHKLILCLFFLSLMVSNCGSPQDRHPNEVQREIIFQKSDSEDSLNNEDKNQKQDQDSQSHDEEDQIHDATRDDSVLENFPKEPQMFSSFQEDILPILKKKCTKCHSSQHAMSHLRLDIYHDESDTQRDLQTRWKRVFNRIYLKNMPPPQSEALNDKELQTLNFWFQIGFPEEKKSQNPSSEPLPLPENLPGDYFDYAQPLATLQIQHLSKFEYTQTIHDLFPQNLALTNEIFHATKSLPTDNRKGGYENMHWSLSSQHIFAYFKIAKIIANYFMNHPEATKNIVPCWTQSKPTMTCLKNWLDEFGLQVLRRPLLQEEKVNLWNHLINSPSSLPHMQIASAMMVLLQSPSFLYHMESKSEIMTEYDMASKLSYTIWKTTPDRKLLQLAKEEKLLDRDSRKNIIMEMLRNPKAKKSFRHFVTQWLNLDHKELPNNQDLQKDIKTENLLIEAREELYTFLEDQIWSRNASLSELFSSPTAYMKRNSQISKLYGLPLSEENSIIELPESQRAGLLSRPFLWFNGNITTNPIHRGAFLITKILCEHLDRPDPNNLPPGSLDPPQYDTNTSTRELWEARTNQPACLSCHSRINPLGFAFEMYDTFGRYREEEMMFDHQKKHVRDLAIKQDVVLGIDQKWLSLSGPIELQKAIAHSHVAKKCFAQQWYKFAFHQGKVVRNSQIWPHSLQKFMNNHMPILDFITSTLLD